MPPEEFFTGTTQAGRTLVLFYEHTAYDTFTDETGEIFDNPAETKVTATLDGAPINVQVVNWSTDGTATVRSEDLGTFTATSTDYAEDHSEALRRYLEHRPSEGYEVAIVDKRQAGDEASYTVTISNGRLTERAEFRLSPQVMRTLACGADAASDEQVRHEIAQQVRRDNWERINERTTTPTRLRWIAHPS
jgi:hypothetical protein